MGTTTGRSPGTILAGVRPVDWALTVVLTGLGVVLMVENVTISDAGVDRNIASGSMAHAMSGHSWAMLPVFALATLPVLWWRRNVVAVTAAALVVIVGHDLAFGWVTRCGAGLPLVFVLAYLGAVSADRARAVVVLVLGAALTVAILVVDATTGPGTILLALPIMLIVFGVGRAVRHRTAMTRELTARTLELQRLREERVALELAGDRARLSRELDGLLQQRLDQLSSAAEAGSAAGPEQARSLFGSIEADSRATLDGMREIIGQLRGHASDRSSGPSNGQDVALAPAPSVAHLDALLTRTTGADRRIAVTGDPRSLPATVELSAYRIVEHLVTVLADRPDAPMSVSVRFADDVLELRIRGAVGRSAEIRAAVLRARERARLLGGSLEVKVSRGRAEALAELPVLG